MPVPSDITALSTTAASNSPPGSETPSSIDDYLRTHASFIAQLRAVIGGTVDANIPNAATKQSSVTDTTAGRVLQVGAFGLGTLGNIPNTGNMDAMLPTGLYKFANGVDTGTLPSGTTNGVLISETFTTAISRQTFYAVNGAADITSIFTRQIRGTTTIGPWTQLITGSTGLGSYKGAWLITTSSTLTAEDAGMLFQFFTGSTLTTTLPLYNAVPVGTNIRLFNNSAVTQTIQRQGTNTVSWAKDPAATTSISIPAGCFIDIATTLTADTWVVVADNVLAREYVSAEQTITSAGQLILAHGFGVMPKRVTAELVCKTAELGYSVNDVVQIHTGQQSNSAADVSGLSTRKDATNITIRYGSGANAFILANATTGAGAGITNGNWRLIVRAWA